MSVRQAGDQTKRSERTADVGDHMPRRDTVLELTAEEYEAMVKSGGAAPVASLQPSEVKASG